LIEASELMQKLSLAEQAPETSVLMTDEEKDLARIAKHREWLKNIRHEVPSPAKHYNVGVYIRYYNQTKHGNYIDYHTAQYTDTLALCPNWNFVGFYIDEGAVAPNMESAKEWSRLLQDCMDGKVNLIITQKVSNVSRKDYEIAFVARMLAALDNPVGIYFVSEDIFTLASYYQNDLRDTGFFPDENWKILPDDDSEVKLLSEESQRSE